MKKIVLLFLVISSAIAGFAQTAFTAGNIVIYRAGDGSAVLSSNATPVFIDEYNPSGPLVQSIPMPVAVNGINGRLTCSGTATSEGAINRSLDGAVVTCAGYDAAVGTAAVVGANATTVNRTVAVISLAGTVDVSTRLTDFASTSNPRGTISVDGNAFWISGGAGAVRYAVKGATTSTQLNATPTNIRTVNIINNQLFFSSASGTFIGVNSFPGAPPTTSGQTATLILPPTSAYGFAGNSTGTVIYVADDRTIATGGGILKYTYNGTTWSLATTFGTGVGSTVGARGLAVNFSGASPVIYATTSEAAGTSNRVIKINDDGLGAPAVVIATSPTNTVFRGVALGPVASVVPLHFISFTGSKGSTGYDLKWVTANEQNVAAFTVQKSTDGATFEDISSTSAQNNSIGANYNYNYTGTDKGVLYFRIKATELSGKTSYTDIIKTNLTSASFRLYPTVTKGNITVEYGTSASAGTLSIVNMNGAEVYRKNVAANLGTENINVQQIPAGTYFIRYSTEKGQPQTLRFVKQ